MNYTHLISELNQANLFDLYRLSAAIDKELENPQRISSIKQKLRIGMELTYFDTTENRLLKAQLLKMKQKKVVVLDHETNQQFVMPYYMLNLDGVDTDIHETHPADRLTANMLKVGDCVGFNRDGESIVGLIKRLNHKTVTMETSMGDQWRVAYPCLYRIHDAEIARNTLMLQEKSLEVNDE